MLNRLRQSKMPYLYESQRTLREFEKYNRNTEDKDYQNLKQSADKLDVRGMKKYKYVVLEKSLNQRCSFVSKPIPNPPAIKLKPIEQQLNDIEKDINGIEKSKLETDKKLSLEARKLKLEDLVTEKLDKLSSANKVKALELIDRLSKIESRIEEQMPPSLTAPSRLLPRFPNSSHQDDSDDDLFPKQQPR
jgi:hypothetical protein